MNKYDASYRLLFSNPAIVRGLFQGIVRAPWQDLVNWDQLEPLPADYISDKLRQRQGDIVWRLPRLDGPDVFLLLMIEHQSTIDFYMALRILTYLGLLYEALLARKLIKPGEPLPMVLPIVIYSGVPRWNATLNVSDLIRAIPQGLRRFLPQLQYLLVDEGALVASGKLPQNNLAALLFRLEHNRGLHDVEDLIQKVYNYSEADPFVRRAFASWTRYVLLPRSLPDVDMPQIDDLLEIKNMLAEHSRSWTHQWKMEGQTSIVHNQLIRKFGPLPESVRQRLETATPEDLQKWSLALLEACSLDEVFGG